MLWGGGGSRGGGGVQHHCQNRYSNSGLPPYEGQSPTPQICQPVGISVTINTNLRGDVQPLYRSSLRLSFLQQSRDLHGSQALLSLANHGAATPEISL